MLDEALVEGLSFVPGILLSLGFTVSLISVLALCGCCKCCAAKVKIPTDEEADAPYARAVMGNNNNSSSPGGTEPGDGRVVISLGAATNRHPKQSSNTPEDPGSSKPLLPTNRALPSLPPSVPPAFDSHSNPLKTNQSSTPKDSLTRESSSSDLYASVDKCTKTKHVYAKIREKNETEPSASSAFGNGAVGYSAIDDDEEESDAGLYSKIHNKTKTSSITIQLAQLPNNERVYEYPTFRGAPTTILPIPSSSVPPPEPIYEGSSEDPYSSIKSDSDGGIVTKRKPEEPVYEGVGPASSLSGFSQQDPAYATIHPPAERNPPGRNTNPPPAPLLLDSHVSAEDERDIDQLYAKIRRRHSAAGSEGSEAPTHSGFDRSRASAGPGYPNVPEKRFSRSDFQQFAAPNPMARLPPEDNPLDRREFDEITEASGSTEPPYKYITVREPLDTVRARLAEQEARRSEEQHERTNSDPSAHYYSSISEHSYEVLPPGIHRRPQPAGNGQPQRPNVLASGIRVERRLEGRGSYEQEIPKVPTSPIPPPVNGRPSRLGGPQRSPDRKSPPKRGNAIMKSQSEEEAVAGPSKTDHTNEPETREAPKKLYGSSAENSLKKGSFKENVILNRNDSREQGNGNDSREEGNRHDSREEGNRNNSREEGNRNDAKEQEMRNDSREQGNRNDTREQGNRNDSNEQNLKEDAAKKKTDEEGRKEKPSGIAKLVVNSSTDALSSEPADKPLEVKIPGGASPSRRRIQSRSRSRDKLSPNKTNLQPKGSPRWADSAPPRKSPSGTFSPTPFDATDPGRLPSSASSSSEKTPSSSATSSPEKKPNTATVEPMPKTPGTMGHDIHHSNKKHGSGADGHPANCFCHSHRPDPVAIVKANISTIQNSTPRSGSEERENLVGARSKGRNASSVFRL